MGGLLNLKENITYALAFVAENANTILIDG